MKLEAIRSQFPSLKNQIGGKPFIYLDSAATTLKPQRVLDVIDSFYGINYSTVRRGVYHLSEKATAAYERSRIRTKEFMNAASEKEIIFTGGTTDAINLVAYTFGRQVVSTGDEVLICETEHHANIVPWKMLCEEKNARLVVVEVNDKGEIILDDFIKKLSDRTKLVCMAHVSNSLGTIHPIKKIIELAHEKNVAVLIDGAQGAPHLKIDVQDLDCDFYAFSGHKIYGPTGVGVLYGKYHQLEKMPPFRGGGDMIDEVSFEKITYQKPPHRFEAGTPAIVEVIALAEAYDFIDSIGIENIAAHESLLVELAHAKLQEVPGLKIIGTAKEKAGVVSFIMDGCHPTDLGMILDKDGIAIRSGHHCAMPTMKRFGVPATARASFGVYTSEADIDQLVISLKKAAELFL